MQPSLQTKKGSISANEGNQKKKKSENFAFSKEKMETR